MNVGTIVQVKEWNSKRYVCEITGRRDEMYSHTLTLEPALFGRTQITSKAKPVHQNKTRQNNKEAKAMKVKFKRQYTDLDEVIQYQVKNETEVIAWDEIMQKDCPQIELEGLGLVPLELLEETDDLNENVDAIDVIIQLEKQNPE